MNSRFRQSLETALAVVTFRGAIRVALLAFFLLFATVHPAMAQAGDSYGKQIDNKFSGQAATGPDENSMTAGQIKMLDLDRAVKAQAQRMSRPPPPPPPPLPTESIVATTVVFVLAVALVVAIGGLLAKHKLDSVTLATEAALAQFNVLETDPSLDVFFTELRDGLSAQVDISESSTETASPSAAQADLESFQESLPRCFADLRALLSRVAAASEVADRKQPLALLYDQVTGLKDSARVHAREPARFLACALDGLLKQILNGTSEFTASIHRSIHAAIDLLEILCAKGVNPALASDPPIRILAVDDDPISRCGISFALKKVFDAPALASGGMEALALAAQQSYDIIFLDVEMPGMDGFELCTRIHETAPNLVTPVVFVTRHSDFRARAKSNLSGGVDLIGKPYVSFEITVKALTLVLRNRLQNSAIAPHAVAAPVSPAIETPAPDKQRRGDRTNPAQRPGFERLYSTTVPSTYSANTESSDSEPEQDDSVVTFAMPANDPAGPFSRWAPVYLESLRNQLRAVARCTDLLRLFEFLTGAHAAIQRLTTEAERAGLHSIHKLSSVLERMVQKLSQAPSLCAPSTLDAAIGAVELLAELSARNSDGPDFANPPARILVVDDDPLARRAVSFAVQLIFGRPDAVENGEAAAAIAADSAFDLIFLDVVMPGIDGFATCEKIHESNLNRQTPVIFVTTRDDDQTRGQASLAGGSGFLPKPVLSSQLALIALTGILRTRLGKGKLTPAKTSADSEAHSVSAL